jgi:hypothetical protein
VKVTCQDDVRIDNIFDVERNVIPNATGRNHRNLAGCTIGKKCLASLPIAARAVLHQQPLVKKFDDSHKRVFKLRYGRARSRLRSGLEEGHDVQPSRN